MKKGLAERRYRQNVIIMIMILILCLLRLWLGYQVRYYFISDAVYDDSLLISYSHIGLHFRNPDYLSMVKTMSFPLALSVFSRLHLNFSTAMSLLWIVSALLFFRLIQYLFHNRWLSLVAFAYILFHPVAYTGTTGLRVYRNTIIAPFVMMTFCEMFEIYFHASDHKEKTYCKIIRSIFFAILLVYTYFIKEDGIWILACVLFFFLIMIALSALKTYRKKETARNLVTCIIYACIPIGTLFGGNILYRQVNKKYFGVAEIQTRTEGELGEFVTNIYQINSPQQTYMYTAPAESITAAYNVSPTFQEYPQLYEAIMHSDMYDHDIVKNPIRGDFLTWVLRVALHTTGVWKSEKQVSDLFEQINDELEEAFRDGKIKKNKRIQLLPSAVGRTPEEILSIFPCMMQNFVTVLTLKNYSADITDLGNLNNIQAAEEAADRTGLTYLTDYSFTESSSYRRMVTGVSWFIWLYRLFNLALVCGAAYALVSFLATHRKRKRTEKSRKIVFSAVMLICISLAYSFSIIWFAQFCMTSEKTAIQYYNFYTTSLIPLLALAGFLLIGNRLLISGKHLS